MSLLLLLEPCGLEVLNLGLLSRPLIRWGIILIFELRNEFCESGIFVENFLNPSPWWRSVSNC
jgi:hypothetical protein